MSFYAVYPGSLSAAGAAYDTGAGATTANTLRTVIVTDQTTIPVTSTSATLNFGVASAAGRVAALVGNASGIADFGAGNVSAQTLRTIIATDQGAIPVSQSGSWTVTASVSNFPATQPVSGTVAVSNFPATQPVSGTVTANQGTGGSSAWKVDGSAVTQPVSGTVAVSNFPATQPVSGTVAVTQSTSPWVTSSTAVVADIAYSASGSIAFGSLTNSYTTVITTTAISRIIYIFNSLDQPILVSLDGTADSFSLSPGDECSVDLGASGLKLPTSSTIKAKYTGSAPTVGSVRVSVLG
jgi:hypothetical protein